jgi:hypothetical protein
MKLACAKNDDLVTIRFDRHYAIVEAGALKPPASAGGGAIKGWLDEWTLFPDSYDEL